MSYYDNQYDNLYPLHPQFIETDTANDIHPRMHKTAPSKQISTDNHYIRQARVNTFSMERMLYDMNRQINYIFYITILLIILTIIVVFCSVITVTAVSISGKRV